MDSLCFICVSRYHDVLQDTPDGPAACGGNVYLLLLGRIFMRLLQGSLPSFSRSWGRRSFYFHRSDIEDNNDVLLVSLWRSEDAGTQHLWLKCSENWKQEEGPPSWTGSFTIPAATG